MKWDKRMVIVLIVFSFFLAVTGVQAQVKWDGEGGDSLWQNPLNWAGNMTPSSGDKVVLDHSFVPAEYTVVIGNGPAVEVFSVVIDPAGEDSIFLILPDSNILSPAMTITGIGYSLHIKDRGVFINSSGAGSGIPVVIADSLKIDNGGHYIHRTARSHAALVTALSRAPGTEQGIFEFDIPDASSTLSLSSRVYGSLVLSSTAAGSTINYTASGTKAILVRSDFQINPGVKLRLNFSDTFFIWRDLLQHGGSFNLSTGARELVLAVKHNIIQDSGQILESGSAHPQILLNGNTIQDIDMKGSITDEVSMCIDNNGAVNRSPSLLPYGLFLKRGKMVTGEEALLTIGPDGFVRVDSSSDISYIEGPVRKLGLEDQYFLFPVGKSGHLRWIALYHATGDLTVEFMREDPRLVNPVIHGMNRISALEYWKLQTEGIPGSGMRAAISFQDANESGVTDLSTLCVASLQTTGWENAGNTASSGTAGSAGSVTSTMFTPELSGISLFTFGATVSSENPLPLNLVDFTGTRTGSNIRFRWNIFSGPRPLEFEIDSSSDGKQFTVLQVRPFQPETRTYTFNTEDHCPEQRFYKLRVKLGEDLFEESRIIVIPGAYSPSTVLEYISLKSPLLYLHFHSRNKQKIRLYLADQVGNIVMVFDAVIPSGDSVKEIRLNNLAAGIYHIFGLSSTERTNSRQFFFPK